MARKIVITSGKGGVGKTTVTANLGIYLAKLGIKTVLVDLDIGLNNLDVAMGVENKIVFDLVDCIENRCRVRQALIQDETQPNLYVLPSCHADKRSITAQSIKSVINNLSDQFDYILIDCPAGIEVGFHRAVTCADEAIVVCTPHLSSIRDCDKVLQILKTYPISAMRVIINRLRGDLVVSGEMIDAFEIFSLLKATPLGILPEDDTIGCSGLTKDGSAATNAYTILANNLTSGKSEMYNCLRKYSGIFGKIRAKKIGRN